LAFDGPLAAIARNAMTRARLGLRVLLIWELAVEDGGGRCVFSSPIAAAISLTRAPVVRADPRWVDGLIRSASAIVLPEDDALSLDRRSRAISSVQSFIAARIARERDIAAIAAPAAFQPGLFDRRAHHADAAARAARQEMANAGAIRVAMLEQRAGVSILPPVLRLVLIP
jgi:hypothetical protein